MAGCLPILPQMIIFMALYCAGGIGGTAAGAVDLVIQT